MRPPNRSAGPLACALAALLAAGPLVAGGADAAPPAADPAMPVDAPAVPAPTGTEADGGTMDPGSAPMPAHQRSGAQIYAAFREGLAEPGCAPGDASPRWTRHFSAAPRRLATGDETLALFGYVVDALRAAHLPTEYALIPFVESGYRPDARSRLGPAGLWQFIALTARNHKVAIRDGYDGRLSPVDSTRAAVRYLKTLHGMFAGDWRLAAMAYNAGEYRVLGALRRSGQVARDADHARLTGLPGITRAYPRKMHAIACLLQQADDDLAWLEALDRPVARLVAAPLAQGTRDIDAWARGHGLDPERVRRLNPAFRNGRVVRLASEPLQVLAPAVPAVDAIETTTVAAAPASTAAVPPQAPPTGTSEPATSVPTPPAHTRPR